MKKLYNKLVNAVRQMNRNVTAILITLWQYTIAFHRAAVAGRRGEGYIDTAVKILIAVVLGALLLAALYALFNNTVMPTVTQRVKDMFDYVG